MQGSNNLFWPLFGAVSIFFMLSPPWCVDPSSLAPADEDAH